MTLQEETTSPSPKSHNPMGAITGFCFTYLVQLNVAIIEQIGMLYWQYKKQEKKETLFLNPRSYCSLKYNIREASRPALALTHFTGFSKNTPS